MSIKRTYTAYSEANPVDEYTVMENERPLKIIRLDDDIEDYSSDDDKIECYEDIEEVKVADANNGDVDERDFFDVKHILNHSSSDLKKKRAMIAHLFSAKRFSGSRCSLEDLRKIPNKSTSVDTFLNVAIELPTGFISRPKECMSYAKRLPIVGPFFLEHGVTVDWFHYYDRYGLTKKKVLEKFHHAWLKHGKNLYPLLPDLDFKVYDLFETLINFLKEEEKGKDFALTPCDIFVDIMKARSPSGKRIELSFPCIRLMLKHDLVYWIRYIMKRGIKNIHPNVLQKYNSPLCKLYSLKYHSYFSMLEAYENMKHLPMNLIRDLVPYPVLKRIGLVIFARFANVDVSNVVYCKLTEKLGGDTKEKKDASLKKGLKVAVYRKSERDLKELLELRINVLTIPMMKTILLQHRTNLIALALNKIKVGLPSLFLKHYLDLEKKEWSIYSILCRKCEAPFTEKLSIFLDSIPPSDFIGNMKTKVDKELKEFDDDSFSLFVRFVHVFCKYFVNHEDRIMSMFHDRIVDFAKTKTDTEWEQLLSPLINHAASDCYLMGLFIILKKTL